jgi:hypothetical protein
MKKSEDSFYIVYCERCISWKKYSNYEEASKQAVLLSKVYLDQKVYILKSSEYFICEVPEPTKRFIY